MKQKKHSTEEIIHILRQAESESDLTNNWILGGFTSKKQETP